jgi:hypothetical protein
MLGEILLHRCILRQELQRNAEMGHTASVSIAKELAPITVGLHSGFNEHGG